MLKISTVSYALTALLATLTAFSANAAPQQGKDSPTEQAYIGVFAPGKTYAQDVYVITSTIKIRGDLRRFQEYQVFHQEQDAGLGYKYIQVISYRIVNCREGSSGMQRTVSYDAQGRQVDDSLSSSPELTIPEPEGINEKTLDFVCDYKK